MILLQVRLLRIFVSGQVLIHKQTLSRLHVCATLAFSQLLGSVVVIIARATAPNKQGPGTVFPDAAKWDPAEGLSGSPISFPLFWVALVCQLIIVVGYFWFYRKEQLCTSPFLLPLHRLSDIHSLYSSTLIFYPAASNSMHL
jgi:hypothetical protein